MLVLQKIDVCMYVCMVWMSSLNGIVRSRFDGLNLYVYKCVCISLSINICLNTWYECMYACDVNVNAVIELSDRLEPRWLLNFRPFCACLWDRWSHRKSSVPYFAHVCGHTYMYVCMYVCNTNANGHSIASPTCHRTVTLEWIWCSQTQPSTWPTPAPSLRIPLYYAALHTQAYYIARY